ncbi:hypothetical protein FHS96_000274 [Sphingomonas zeicaulis]|uniref:hypothetical protein n=1 Tax=Sphingomonas zeicaulis TaxID=1632740 RepID=UPI003D1CFD1A
MFDAAKRQEWARMWPLPFVAMLGVARAGVFALSSGVFMDAGGNLDRRLDRGWCAL